MKDAACRIYRPAKSDDSYEDKFFPTVGTQADNAILEYCFRCVTRIECSNYADRVGATSGVWGGELRTAPRKKENDSNLD